MKTINEVELEICKAVGIELEGQHVVSVKIILEVNEHPKIVVEHLLIDDKAEELCTVLRNYKLVGEIE